MRRHVRARAVVDVLADKGAAMREEDRVALERLKGAYRSGSEEVRSLLVADMSHLKLIFAGESAASPPSEARSEGRARLGSHVEYNEDWHPVNGEQAPTKGSTGASAVPASAAPLGLRSSDGGSIFEAIGASEVPQFWPDGYVAPPLEAFLRSLGSTNPAFGGGGSAGEGGVSRLWADGYAGSMESVLAAAKLFVMERVASGCTKRPLGAFAIHIATMPTSIARDSTRAMR